MKDGYRPLCLKSGETTLFHNLGWYREFFVPAYIAGAFFYFISAYHMTLYFVIHSFHKLGWYRDFFVPA
ncbi:hypothetical protein FC702_42330 [Bacillus cereus]|nr:hypothetical protein FC702_42330 [Bacillus cereus]